MKKSLIGNSTYLVGISLKQTDQIVTFVNSKIGPCSKKRERQARKFLEERFSMMFNLAEYQNEWERFGLLPPSVIETVIASTDVVPDGYDSDDGTVKAIYYYEGLLAYALEQGLVVENQRERTEEIVHQRVVTETYYAAPDVLPALPDYTQKEADHE